jgi:hypothetical protein
LRFREIDDARLLAVVEHVQKRLLGNEATKSRHTCGKAGLTQLVAEPAKGRRDMGVISFRSRMSYHVRTEFARLDARLAGLRAELASPTLTLARWEAISNNDLTSLPSEAKRMVSILRIQKAYRDTGLPSSDILVVVATSIEKSPSACRVPLAARPRVETVTCRQGSCVHDGRHFSAFSAVASCLPGTPALS